MFWRDDFNTSLRIGHTGAMPGSLTYMFYHPVDKTGVIYLVNQHLIYRIVEFVSWFKVMDLLFEKSETY